MDRREFTKLIFAAILVPSLPLSTERPKFPVEYKYKEWSIRFDERMMPFPCIQGYARKGEKHGAVLFDMGNSTQDIEKQFKLWLDRLDKRAT